MKVVKEKTHSLFLPKINLNKKFVTSGGSRNLHFFQNFLFIKLRLTKLSLRTLAKSGRNNTGKLTVRTQKSLKFRYKKPKLNYTCRYLGLTLISNVVITPKTNKLYSTLVMSSGSVTYVPSTTKHELFILNQTKSLLYKPWNFSLRNKKLFDYLNFKIISSLIFQLPKNKPVSLLELLPGKSIQFTRSPGSHSVILKMNSLTGTALIRLSSGVKKIFSIYSIGSEGRISLQEKKKCYINKAGFYKNFGKKSIVRGVAKNPVDHPHGGRTKAIKYQRTPWGKTTKFK